MARASPALLWCFSGFSLFWYLFIIIIIIIFSTWNYLPKKLKYSCNVVANKGPVTHFWWHEASAQSDQSLRCPHEKSLGPRLPTESTAKTLIRLGGCPGWSESSLGAHSFCWFCHVSYVTCWNAQRHVQLLNFHVLTDFLWIYNQGCPSFAFSQYFATWLLINANGKFTNYTFYNADFGK